MYNNHRILLPQVVDPSHLLCLMIFQEYKVVDASENELMVVVKHKKDYYNLYISDVTGAKFSLSLENILSTTKTIWGKKTLLVDLHRVLIILLSYTMTGLGMNFLFFFLSTPEQRTLFTYVLSYDVF